MRSADVTALVDAHVRGDHQRFVAVARTIAANERSSGRDRVAGQLERLVGASGPSTAQALGSAVSGFAAPLAAKGAPILDPDTAAKVSRVCAEHAAAERLAAAGLAPVNSLLLVGPPGVGKSMTAAWIGDQISLPTYMVSIEGLIDSHLGVSGRNLSTLFDEVCTRAAVWVFDEFDSLAATRNGSNDVGETMRLVNSLLRMMDRPRPGIVVACTNRPDAIDPAVHDRFETTIEFPALTRQSAHTMLEAALSGTSVDPAAVAPTWDGRSHRQLVQAIQMARKTATLDARALALSDLSHPDA